MQLLVEITNTRNDVEKHVIHLSLAIKTVIIENPVKATSQDDGCRELS